MVTCLSGRFESQTKFSDDTNYQVSGKIPPGKKPPGKLSPRNLPPGKLPPGKFSPGILPPENCSPEKCPPQGNCFTSFSLLLTLSYSC